MRHAVRDWLRDHVVKLQAERLVWVCHQSFQGPSFGE